MPDRVFDLPDLGEGLEDAEIVEWKVAEGDTVELNQPLVDVNTAKALVEIPSPFAGVVKKLHGKDGDVVKVGEPLITIEVADAAGEPAAPTDVKKREAVLVGYGVEEQTQTKRKRRLRPPGARRAPAAARTGIAEDAVAASGESGAAEAVVKGEAALERASERGPAPDATPAPESMQKAVAYADQPATDAPKRVRAAPPVRKLAKERGVDLSTVQGSGPEGRITRDDVLRVVEEGTPVAYPLGEDTGEDERIPVRGVRRLIAQKMTRSWTEIPHVTTFHPVDATWIEALRRELTEETGSRVSALAIVVKALVEACRRDHPKLNASWEDDEIVLHRSYHVGIATDTERGLMVPVVRDADVKGIATIAREIAEVVAVAREGKASPEQLTGSTITVTNYGVFGSHYGTPIINHPEAAILGLGAIEPRPFVIEGRVEARPGVVLALSFDHRVLDGADADRAMRDLRALLESPLRLGTLQRL